MKKKTFEKVITKTGFSDAVVQWRHIRSSEKKIQKLKTTIMGTFYRLSHV